MLRFYNSKKTKDNITAEEKRVMEAAKQAKKEIILAVTKEFEDNYQLLKADAINKGANPMEVERILEKAKNEVIKESLEKFNETMKKIILEDYKRQLIEKNSLSK